jgi:hypothetical protein
MAGSTGHDAIVKLSSPGVPLMRYLISGVHADSGEHNLKLHGEGIHDQSDI